MKFVPVLTLLAAIVVAQAQPPIAMAAPAAGAPAMATGEVLKVYKKEKRLLLKHGPIKSIQMDAMTMEFSVADRTLLNGLKPGDKIRFAARRVGDDYRVTALEVMK